MVLKVTKSLKWSAHTLTVRTLQSIINIFWENRHFYWRWWKQRAKTNSGNRKTKLLYEILSTPKLKSFWWDTKTIQEVVEQNKVVIHRNRQKINHKKLKNCWHFSDIDQKNEINRTGIQVCCVQDKFSMITGESFLALCIWL
jgi:hypothetical protein